MGNKSKGTTLELGTVKKAFKAGCWGFRAPGSGGFTPNKDPASMDGIQLDCTIPLIVAHVDFSFNTNTN